MRSAEPVVAGERIDETGMLRRAGGAFVLDRDDGGRLLLHLSRTPVDEVEKRVRLIGTACADGSIDVDGVSLA